MEIKEFLKEKRAELGLTQEKARNKIGISSGFMADIESGKRMPSDEMAEKIAEAYNLNQQEKKDFLLSIGLSRASNFIVKYIKELENENEKLKEENEHLNSKYKELESLKTQNTEIKPEPETKTESPIEEIPPKTEIASITDEEIKELFETMTQNEKGAVKYHYVEDDMYNKKVTFENYAKEYIKKNPVFFQERRKKQLKYELQYKKAEENYKTMSVELRSCFEKEYLELTNNEQKKYKSKKQYLIERYRKDFYGENAVDNGDLV